jgi:hypothetical protein
MSSFEIVAEKARRHKEAYPTFDLDRFLEDVQAEGNRFIGWARSQSTARVNRSLRYKRGMAAMALAGL